VPTRRAFTARREVAAPGIAAGIAKTDRHDRDARLVVKSLAIEGQPFAQPVAAAIIERKAGIVDPRPRRLADDKQPGRRSAAQDRPGSERQMGRADRTFLDVFDQTVEVHFHFGRVSFRVSLH
jgi:hypothetical protein